MESLVTPARDGKIDNIFLQCIVHFEMSPYNIQIRYYFMNAPDAVSKMFVFCFQKCASCNNAQDLCVPQVSPASHKKFIMILYTVFIIPMA